MVRKRSSNYQFQEEVLVQVESHTYEFKTVKSEFIQQSELNRAWRYCPVCLTPWRKPLTHCKIDGTELERDRPNRPRGKYA